jgi:hypothetical protein
MRPRIRPNEVGLLSSAPPLGTGVGVIVWFHVAPTAPVLGDSGTVAGGTVLGGTVRGGRCLAGRERPASLTGASSVASVVATPPKMPRPSLAGPAGPGRPAGAINSGASPACLPSAPACLPSAAAGFPVAAAGAAGGSTMPVSGSGSSGRSGGTGGAADPVGSAEGGLPVPACA